MQPPPPLPSSSEAGSVVSGMAVTTSTTTAAATLQQQQLPPAVIQMAQASPISTLERQYQQPPHLFMVVHANAACCVTISEMFKLQQQQQQQQQQGGGGGGNSHYTTTETATTSLSMISDDTSTTLSTLSHAETGDDNPFSFLQQSDTTSTSTNHSAAPVVVSMDGTMEYSTTTARHRKNPMAFLKKVAASTTKSIERGMHQLAVKVADPQRSTDLLVVGLFDITHQPQRNQQQQQQQHNGNQNPILLSLTEPEPIPTLSSGVQFRIPLILPCGISSSSAGQLVQLQLFVRSGGGTFLSSKHYTLAVSAPIPVAPLQEALLQKTNREYLTMPIRMHSALVVLGGQLTCLVRSDDTGKFPRPALTTAAPQRGWSLQDPNPQTAYGSNMFHLPFDQTYIFPLPRPPSLNHSILPVLQATERTVESTVLLPIATCWAKCVTRAAQRSYHHMIAVRNDIYQCDRMDCAPSSGSSSSSSATTNDVTTNPIPAVIERDYADVMIKISHLRTNTTASSYLQEQSSSSPLMVSVVYQRPDSIFETELLPMTKLPLHPMAAGGLRPDISCHFFPTPISVSNALPAMIASTQTQQNGMLLGNVRIQITLPLLQSRNNSNSMASRVLDPTTMGCGSINTVIDNPFDPMYITTPSVDDTWECIVPLDMFIQVGAQQHPKEFPVYNIHGQCMGSMVISFTVKMMMMMSHNPRPPNATSLAAGGLVPMVGLTNVVDGILPTMDFVDHSTGTATAEQLRRRSQLATMGHFVTYHYLDQHIQTVRQLDCEIIKDRAIQYQQALDAAYSVSSSTTESVPSYQDRTPKPFRPSSSRNTMLLSGIGFNVHTASMSLEVIEESSQQQQQKPEPAGAVLHNITCGAPADHARGFGNVFATGKEKSNTNSASAATASANAYQSIGFKSPIGPVVGGLRRMESARKALATEIQNQQTMLIMSIANYFVGQRQKIQSSSTPVAGPGTQQRPTTHVPVGNEVLQNLRGKIFEAVQCLHHLTWICAVRRASVFSQALGIAVSSYLSSVSDRTKQQSNWPELWTRHGFLISYEGLLSAAGKELGMIEDASVGIDMLRMVRMVLVPDTGPPPAAVDTSPTRVPVPHSLYLRWMDLTPQPTPNGQDVEYILQIGIDQQYFHQHIPTALKNGTSVRFYPILFEVGVDIFQAASNLGSSVSRHVNTSTATAACEPDIAKDVVNDDDDDDVVGISDDDVLVQLNYEAFQKLNTYAQSVAPAPLVQATPQYQTHPLLATLFQHILSSSGKMNHEILAEAAALALKFSGGIVVFCKSGKDRTAMHLTYKQAQFIARFRQDNPGLPAAATVGNEHEETATDSTLNDAMLIRLYGTRLPICEKNVGQAKYAFNSLQVKFMPDALKPPPSALAGFLKGGKVFGGGHGIES